MCVCVCVKSVPSDRAICLLLWMEDLPQRQMAQGRLMVCDVSPRARFERDMEVPGSAFSPAQQFPEQYQGRGELRKGWVWEEATCVFPCPRKQRAHQLWGVLEGCRPAGCPAELLTMPFWLEEQRLSTPLISVSASGRASARLRVKQGKDRSLHTGSAQAVLRSRRTKPGGKVRAAFPFQRGQRSCCTKRNINSSPWSSSLPWQSRNKFRREDGCFSSRQPLAFSSGPTDSQIYL